MLAKLDVRYVIAGHSERRELFARDRRGRCGRRWRPSSGSGMTPILCCGETLEEREADQTEAKVRGQVEAGLDGLKADQVGRAGHRLRADLGDRHRSHRQQRGRAGRVRAGAHRGARALRRSRGRRRCASSTAGRSSPSNAAELMAQPDIDGALVGGASLEAEDFARIVQFRL